MLNDALTHSAVLIQVQILYFKWSILDFYFKDHNLSSFLLNSNQMSSFLLSSNQFEMCKAESKESDMGFSPGLCLQC